MKKQIAFFLMMFVALTTFAQTPQMSRERAKVIGHYQKFPASSAWDSLMNTLPNSLTDGIPFVAPTSATTTVSPTYTFVCYNGTAWKQVTRTNLENVIGNMTYTITGNENKTVTGTKTETATGVHTIASQTLALTGSIYDASNVKAISCFGSGLGSQRGLYSNNSGAVISLDWQDRFVANVSGTTVMSWAGGSGYGGLLYGGGWRYGGNYGAGFSERSLVDKGYVDSVKTTITNKFLPGISSQTLVVNTGTVTVGETFHTYSVHSKRGFGVADDTISVSMSGSFLISSDEADPAELVLVLTNMKAVLGDYLAPDTRIVGMATGVASSWKNPWSITVAANDIKFNTTEASNGTFVYNIVFIMVVAPA